MTDPPGVVGGGCFFVLFLFCLLVLLFCDVTVFVVVVG